MNQLQTQGIVLSRTAYGEADRIITLLTPEQGKLRLMARGVRKPKSKLAGGIELFSVSDITYLQGRGEIGTLVSSRLLKYYDSIVKDITRVQMGYDLIKLVNRATEDQPEPEYFELLRQSFQALDDPRISTDLIRLWFEASLLRQAGHTPNLQTDTASQKLTAGQTYNFDFDAVAFVPHADANFSADHIKVLRLLFRGLGPGDLQKVQTIEVLLTDITPLVRIMLQTYIRL